MTNGRSMVGLTNAKVSKFSVHEDHNIDVNLQCVELRHDSWGVVATQSIKLAFLFTTTHGTLPYDGEIHSKFC